MFKLINQEDSKVFENSLFVKTADFFKDEIAFFDAYSNICQRERYELPSYCCFQNGEFSLDGICLFMITYASELGFKTLDLSIDYLKTLYYAIAILSNTEGIVDRQIVVNEYLVYKDINSKQLSQINTKWKTVENDHNKNIIKFEEVNKKQTKYAVVSKTLDICAIVSIILSVFCAIIPSTLYFSGKLILKSAIIYMVASILIGLILYFEFKLFSKHLLRLSLDDAFSLQMLKKNKNESQILFNDLRVKNSKLICENYEYNKNLSSFEYGKKLDFEEILKRAKLSGFITYNLKNDIFNLEKKQQIEIYEILDKIAAAQIGNDARFENIYNEIKDKDYLFYNNLVRFSFLNKFIENATNTKIWTIGEKDKPFDVDVKKISLEKVTFYDSLRDEMLTMNLDMFLQTKYSKNLKNLQIKGVKDEKSLEVAKMEYVNHFYDAKEKSKVNKIPTMIEIKLAILKNRIVCNSLGEKTFLKIKEIVSEYEKKAELRSKKEKRFISERTEQNINILFGILNECDDVQEIGNDEVVCVVGEHKFRGVKFSNI